MCGFEPFHVGFLSLLFISTIMLRALFEASINVLTCRKLPALNFSCICCKYFSMNNVSILSFIKALNTRFGINANDWVVSQFISFQITQNYAGRTRWCRKVSPYLCNKLGTKYFYFRFGYVYFVKKAITSSRIESQFKDMIVCF